MAMTNSIRKVVPSTPHTEWESTSRFVGIELSNIVSEVLLINANSAIFHLYHSENKLIFNEMMMTTYRYVLD